MNGLSMHTPTLGRSAACALGLLMTAVPAGECAADIDINGGLSWNGWTSRGTSTTLGVYGKGSTANVYEVYTTYFMFEGQTVAGAPTGSLSLAAGPTGAFAWGNRVLGVGIRRISGAQITGAAGVPIVRFDAGNDSYTAASSVGGTDGRTSSTLYANAGDFNCQFSTAALAPSNLVVCGGTGSFTELLSNSTGTNSYAFRGFYQASNQSFQFLFDLTRMPQVYGNVGGNAVATLGDTVTLSIRGTGDTDVVLSNLVVPSPGSLALLGLAGAAVRRRRARR